MDEIKVLDSKVFNRIAAGEVVENPKSVIKELVENSIDAGADKITIEIESGGINLIKVVDNGKGISSNDIKTAFFPHATSKIFKIEDLDAISTLGFRGEALPSIASVADVTMISRKRNCDIGYSVKYSCGNMVDEGEVGCPEGTTVLVENLFKNIPARSKFLKKPSQEEADVSDLIVKIILANPMLSIKYIANGQLKYHSGGDGVTSAIFSIYGNDVLENLTKISNVTSYITLSGFVSKPSFSKYNRNFQTLIVNGRYVVNQELSFCIGQCYQEFLMKRQFPMYVLYLEIPLDMVDVNIQPNKMNVKFVDFSRVKGIIYNAIKNLIEKENRIPKNINTFMSSFSPADSVRVSDKEEKNVENKDTNFEKTSILMEDQSNIFNIFSASDKIKNDFNYIENQNVAKEAKCGFNNTDKDNIVYTKTVDDAGKFFKDEDSQLEKECFTNYLFTDNSKSCIETFYSSIEYSIIGKLFNTYIIIQKGNEVLLIDQHAAHEKIIYDKMVDSIDSAQITIQDLLIPYNFAVSNKEKNALCDILNIIKELGIYINYLGELSFSIVAIPSLLAQLDLEKFVSSLMYLLNAEDYIKSSVFIKDNLMQSACKAAVKGEMDLSSNEIENLLNEMKKNNIALFCPHGRPIVVTLTRNEIEKWFKRIV